jgi:hypothetical protein
MSPIDKVLAAAEARGEVKREGAEFVTNCPAHPDEHPSLHIREMDDGKVTVICRSNKCAFKDIAAGWGIPQRDFFPQKPEKPKQNRLGPCVATFLYELTHGKTAYKACRFQFPGSTEKTFLLFRPDGNGKWIANLKDVERIPYRWPELSEAGPSAPVFILEGEKKADLVREKFGMVGTCNPGGTGGSNLWKTPAFQKAVKNRDTIIIPDFDKPGEKHAATVAPAIVSVAKSVRIVRLPLKETGDDIVQWLEAGGTREQLLALVEAAPLWTPQATAAPVEPDAVLSPGDRRNPRDYPLTEQGASELFASVNRGSLLYVPERKSWIQWTGTHWQYDVGGIAALARTRAVSAAFLADAQWAHKHEDVRAASLAKFAARLQQLKVRENVLGGAKAEDGMSASSSTFDTHHTLVNFGNVSVRQSAPRVSAHTGTQAGQTPPDEQARNRVWCRRVDEPG